MLLRNLLTSLVLISLVIATEKVVLADDPPIDPAVVEAQLKIRRQNLQKLEEWVVSGREEIKRQMADVVVGQQDAVAKATKEYEKAKEATEVARYQVKEYEVGIFQRDRAFALGRISLAKIDLQQATELDQQLAQMELEAAKLQLQVLEKYTKEKETKVRQAAVAAAEAIEFEKKGLLEIEKAKEKKLSDQASRLHVRSPEDMVIALIDDAVQAESKAVAILAETQKILADIRTRPADAASLNQQLVTKKDEAIALMNRAKAQLFDAATLGDEVKARRDGLRDAEIKLKKDRELLETLEAQLLPKK